MELKEIIKIIIISIISFGGAMLLFMDRVVYSSWPHLFYKYKKIAFFILLGLFAMVLILTFSSIFVL